MYVVHFYLHLYLFIYMHVYLHICAYLPGPLHHVQLCFRQILHLYLHTQVPNTYFCPFIGTCFPNSYQSPHFYVFILQSSSSCILAAYTKYIRIMIRIPIPGRIARCLHTKFGLPFFCKRMTSNQLWEYHRAGSFTVVTSLRTTRMHFQLSGGVCSSA